jgi:hypothetical protein
MHTRLLTIVFAIIAAFSLQLDTVEIFKLVSSNRTVREKLVAQAGAVEAQAARVLIDTNVLKDALNNWSEQEIDPDVKKALAGVEVKDTDTREHVQKKVADALGALTNKKPINNFDSMVSAAAKKRADELSGELGAVKNDLDKTAFQLFPAKALDRWESGRWNWKGHYLGMLFSAALLSLGAPFWYNLLKNLVNLRSQVAQNISDEQQKQKPPDSSATPPPPTPIPPTPPPAGQPYKAAVAATDPQPPNPA